MVRTFPSVSSVLASTIAQPVNSELITELVFKKIYYEHFPDGHTVSWRVHSGRCLGLRGAVRWRGRIGREGSIVSSLTCSFHARNTRTIHSDGPERKYVENGQPKLTELS